MGAKVLKVMRVLKFDGPSGPEGFGIAAFSGDEYIVSVTGLTFVSPMLHDVVRKPPSPGRRWRR